MTVAYDKLKCTLSTVKQLLKIKAKPNKVVIPNAKKAKVYLINQFKGEQKSSTMSSPTRTAERKMERKIIQ